MTLGFGQQSQPQPQPQQSMTSMTSKPNTGAKIEEGKQQIGHAVKKVGQNEQVQAVGEAVNKAKKKVGDTVAGLFGLGKKKPEQHPGQTLMGGKRRRKSRRKKRTKRRRKSRRKKRRTKRRRKSRRKRRR